MKGLGNSNKFGSGYVLKPKLTSSYNEVNDKNNKKDLPKNWVNGLPLFIILSLFYSICLITFLVLWSKQPTFNKIWPNVVIAVSAVTLILNIFWLLSRTGIFVPANYIFLKVGRITRFDKFKEKTIYNKYDSPTSEIGSMDDYKKYHEIKIKDTKRWCYISVATHTVIFIISLILYLIFMV